MEIIRYNLSQENNGYSLIVFINWKHMEFSRELGKEEELRPSFRQEIRDILIHKIPNVKVTTVKIVMGAMLIGTFPIGEIMPKAAIQQTQETIHYVPYVVQSGDTLYKIASSNGVTVGQISKLNNLIGTTIHVGNTLLLPFVSYTVAPGDTLSSIARKNYSSIDSIKTRNNLKTDIILVGQRLIIPVINPPIVPVNPPIPAPAPVPSPAPITETAQPAPAIPDYDIYTVAAGDSLYSIAKRFNTTVTAIKTENHLASDILSIGQTLKLPRNSQVPAPVPAPVPEPAPTMIMKEYFVVPGDTLFGIAKKFNTTVTQIKEKNNLTTNLINVGQKLVIPVTVETAASVVRDSTPPNVPNVTADRLIKRDNVGAFTVSGTTEANAVVFISLTDKAGGSITKDAKADGNGSFTITMDVSSLQDGNITLSSFAQDEAGNKSNRYSATVMKDTIGPSFLQFNDFSAITQTNVNSYTVSGKTEPNSIVDLDIASQTNSIRKTIQSDGSGNFSLTLDSNTLSDGAITISAVARDQNGNQGEAYQNRILKDTKVNPVTSLVLENYGKINGQNAKEFNISGSSGEEGAIVRFEITDGINILSEDALVLNGAFDKQIDLSTLNDGVLNVRITQVDQAGNISDEISGSIQKDTMANDPVIYDSKIQKIATGMIYKITGQGEPLSTLDISVMGQTGTIAIKQTVKTDENGRFELELNISSLANTKPFVTISQSDTFGNKSRTTIVGITSYVVGSGDSLWAIANRFNTTIDKILSLNNLASTVIYVGQELKLPAIAGISSPVINEQQFFNMGYLYFGNSQTYIDSVRNAENTINVVSPSYFDLNSDGTLKLTSQFDRQFIVTMQSAGVRVVPFLSNHWDRTIGEMALKNREQLATQIAETIRLYNLDGVNVDIENVTEEYRDEYTDFVRLLNEKLPENKEVSVAVAANPYGYRNGWQGSYDYAGLAKYSDYLMIMTYDESYPGSDPGPIASINFVDNSIQYALSQGVAEDQIVMGVGHYGRYWKEGEDRGGDGISNFQIEKALNLYRGTVTFDEATQSAKAVFTIKQGDPIMSVGGNTLTPGTYTVWFENSAAIKAKIDLVREYGIKGLGNWSLGQDNPQIWTDISSWLNPEIASANGTVSQE